jgi:alkanesulfonate monooxygenase SsuD/methylene tetrahydromethanopterin reductase-like flavin-dependent oxidoreductase (luciferase family)
MHPVMAAKQATTVDHLSNGRFTLNISQTLPPGVEQQLKAHFIAGWGGFPLVGTKEQVVDGLALLAKVGFDGVILSWAATSRRCASSVARPIPSWSRRASASAPNPKFAHIVPRVRPRTSGSKGALE